MQKIQWKGGPFKALSFGKSLKKAGRNFSGRITIFHRGGGSKKLYRRIDSERKTAAQGLVERVEYDPNRTARIALVRWSEFKLEKSTNSAFNTRRLAFSYILAWNDIKPGDEVFNFASRVAPSVPQVSLSNPLRASMLELQNSKNSEMFSNGAKRAHFNQEPLSSLFEPLVRFLGAKRGASMPLQSVPIGSTIHNIELQPGKGGQLVRAAGTSAQLVKKGPLGHEVGAASAFASRPQAPLGAQQTHFVPFSSLFSSLRKARRNAACLIRLPSGQQQLLDSRCRVTIGTVSNVDHGIQRLRKAGAKRWLGFRPVVRGVAMNPIDHPHGGGEGRTKGGRPSVSPWGKPSKCGFGSKRKFRQRFARSGS